MTKTKHSEVAKLVASMLAENTGRALCDSGGAYGRNWERNQGKTVDDWANRPNATAEFSVWKRYNEPRPDFMREIDDADRGCPLLVKEISYTIDLFHYLVDRLEIDATCRAFNKRPVEDWDGEISYGVSAEGDKWLAKRFTPFGDIVNTYNHESNLSQVIQFRGLRHKETGGAYVLLQIHGGCDVRGGYTDAKLFRIIEDAYCRDADSFGFEPSVCVWLKRGEETIATLDCRGSEICDPESGRYLKSADLDAMLPDSEEGITAHAEAMES